MFEEANTDYRFHSLEQSEDLELMPRQLAASYQLAPGEIFWKRKDGRLYRLYRAGDPLDQKKINRFYDNNQSLYYVRVLDQASLKTMILYFNEYCQAETERMKINFKDRFFYYLKPIYWDGQRHDSWLTLATCMMQHFYSSGLDQLKFVEDPDSFRRSALVGTLNVIGAMSLGYHKEDYLKDLFILSFFQRISIREKKTPALCKAIDSERRSRAKFQKDYELLTKSEVELFQDHALADYEIVKKQYSNNFKYPAVIGMLRWQHERPLGSGQPSKINQDELSDIELWVAFVSRLFPEKSLDFDTHDGVGALKSYFDTYREKKDEFFFMGRRVFQLIEGQWRTEKKVA
jgi:hypothetical protein